MRVVLVCMLVILVVYGNVWRKCIRNKGRRLECKDTKGNLTCRDISEVMKNVEVLVLRRVYISALDITPVCLPQLKKIIVEKARNMVCKDFKEFEMITSINGQSCLEDTTTAQNETTTSTTLRTTTTSRKKPTRKKTTTSTTTTTAATPTTTSTTTTAATPTTTSANSTEEITWTSMNATAPTTTVSSQRSPLTTREKDLLTAAVFIVIGGLFGFLCLAFAVIMAINKMKRCCRRKHTSIRKIPTPQSLGSLESGSSQTLYLRTLKTE
ncbi:uncharacterized protein [Magallana gigas]|uniref:uncharacterized protein n=1 Tax=Magallana gigas TaxID=29159 RepID=UPI00334087C7